jgi:hypothetical protein
MLALFFVGHSDDASGAHLSEAVVNFLLLAYIVFPILLGITMGLHAWHTDIKADQAERRARRMRLMAQSDELHF